MFIFFLVFIATVITTNTKKIFFLNLEKGDNFRKCFAFTSEPFIFSILRNHFLPIIFSLFFQLDTINSSCSSVLQLVAYWEMSSYICYLRLGAMSTHLVSLRFLLLHLFFFFFLSILKFS